MAKFNAAKDYRLIKNFAKESKSYQKVNNTSFSMISFYGEAPILICFEFKLGRCIYISYEVQSIYDKYANKDVYKTSEAFVDTFIKTSGWYKKRKLNDTIWVECDLSQDFIESDVSQGLLDFSVFCNAMNKFLNKNFDEGFNEKDIRTYSHGFYNKSMNFFKKFGIGSVVVSVVGFILAINAGNIGFLGFLMLIAGLVGAVTSFLKFKNYKRLKAKLKKA